MSFQNKKMFHYFQMAKSRCGMVLTIFVMLMCITLILYSPLNYDAPFNLTRKSPPLSPLEVPNIAPINIRDSTPPINTPAIMAPDHPVEKKVVEKAVTCPVYIFGDSLYDTGIAFFLGMGPMADSYPYGKTYFKRPAGRFSDGLLIPDYIAQHANQPFPEPYGNPVLVEYSRSVNFAGAAAGVLVDGRNYSLNLKLQTDLFEEMVGKMKLQYGKKKTKEIVSKAVLVFNIGSNDYTDIWIQNEKPLNSTFVNAFVNKILGNFTVAITRMYKQGARKFAFQNYGPMGCLPLYRQDDAHCAEGLNDLATLHNAGFAALANTWARHLPGFKYIIYDFYTSLMARVLNGAKYDFKETQTACCGSGRFHAKFTCMEKANFTLCKDIPSHLFFDPAHTTQKANEQFAKEFWSGPPNLVVPFNMEKLCSID
ncbi:GDSL esterase/lipase 4-like isoform X2 [Silene latifolia]|uniref:GDSL esterase/lipase 4-like isoform X2 n=1 Tax=Silene latifolia TaxID=37657 RepID=UPI003D78643C